MTVLEVPSSVPSKITDMASATPITLVLLIALSFLFFFCLLLPDLLVIELAESAGLLVAEVLPVPIELDSTAASTLTTEAAVTDQPLNLLFLILPTLSEDLVLYPDVPPFPLTLLTLPDEERSSTSDLALNLALLQVE
jgi:hypothetical protein